MKTLALTTLTVLALLSACGHKTITLKIPNLPEAPTGFDTSTNGFETQAQMSIDQQQFEESAMPGVLGPFFNSLACVDCHLNPTTGGASAVTEHRVGPDDPKDQVASATLIHDHSVDPNAQQRAPLDATNALRRTLSTFGDSLVEQIPDAVLVMLSKNGGQINRVPILESPGQTRIGRFGWKDQHASLLSFAGDAAANEMGESNRLVTALGDPAGKIEDNDNATATRPEDIDNYAAFMRSLKAPARGPITPSVLKGQKVFAKIGCNRCHVETLYTPWQKFHPFGDYLLHNVGTGDGIAQGGAPANKLRTAPLWGLRTVTRFLHDGRAFDVPTAIVAHSKEAKHAVGKYVWLSAADKSALIDFLLSL